MEVIKEELTSEREGLDSLSGSPALESLIAMQPLWKKRELPSFLDQNNPTWCKTYFPEMEAELLNLKIVRQLLVNQCIYYAREYTNMHRIKTEKKAKASMEGSTKFEYLKFGVIGGGVIGQTLLNTLLIIEDVKPENISVSTRRPETLQKFSSLNIRVFYDNKKLVKDADIVFLCIPSNPENWIVSELKAPLEERILSFSHPFKPLFISVVAGFTAKKFYSMTNQQNIFLKTNIDYKLLGETVQRIKKYSDEATSAADVEKLKSKFKYESSIYEEEASKHLFECSDASTEILRILNETFSDTHIVEEADLEKILRECDEDIVDELLGVRGSREGLVSKGSGKVKELLTARLKLVLGNVRSKIRKITESRAGSAALEQK